MKSALEMRMWIRPLLDEVNRVYGKRMRVHVEHGQSGNATVEVIDCHVGCVVRVAHADTSTAIEGAYQALRAMPSATEKAP